MTPFPVEALIVMESWDVLVLGDGPAALRAAISAAEAGANPLLVSESSVGAASGLPPLSGLSLIHI